MDRQDKLLEKEDGRYYAIDKVGTGLGSIATTEWLNKKIVSFGLPSGPALFLHLAHSAYSRHGHGRSLPRPRGPIGQRFERSSNM